MFRHREDLGASDVEENVVTPKVIELTRAGQARKPSVPPATGRRAAGAPAAPERARARRLS